MATWLQGNKLERLSLEKIPPSQMFLANPIKPFFGTDELTLFVSSTISNMFNIFLYILKWPSLQKGFLNLLFYVIGDMILPLEWSSVEVSSAVSCK